MPTSLIVRAVLFDLDETLIDAQKGLSAAHILVAQKLESFLKLKGIEIDEEFLRTEISLLDDDMNQRQIYDRNEWWHILLERQNVKLQLSNTMLQELTQTYWYAYSEASPPYEDTISTLSYLADKGYRLCLVTDTDGTLGIKKNRIARQAFRHFFEVVIIAGEDTKHTKPDPEPYKLAAERLGVKPNECAFVGDKPFTDIKGAKSVGMLTILVYRRPWPSTEKAEYTVKSLHEICDIL